MNKRKIKLTSLITVIAMVITAIGSIAATLAVSDNTFKKNTPTYFKLGTPVDGSIESADDYEAYMFEVEENGTLSLCLEHDDYLDSAKSGWKTTLYKIIPGEETEYKEICYYESFWSDMTSDWDEVGITPGTYLIMVNPGLYVLESDFTLTTSFEPTEVHECEPNDTKETFSYIDVGYGKYGASSNREVGMDVDWYAFDLTEDSCINLTFNHPAGNILQVGWTVTIYNGNDEKVTQFTSRLSEDIITTGTLGLKADRYYICVEPSTEFSETYTLVIASDRAVNHEFELNDTPETAIELPMNVKISGSLADKLLALDKDYFKFTVTEKGKIDLTFSHDLIEEDKTGWNIRILKPLEDGSMLEIVRKINKWNEASSTIEDFGLEPGTYYVCIDGDSMYYNSASYGVKWVFTADGKFETEPNGSLEQAEDVAIGEYYGGAIISSDVSYDEDYYRFTVDTDTNLCVEFSHEKLKGSSVCWNISILDEEGNVITTSYSALNQNYVISKIVSVSAGTYYVKIETGMYGSEIPYQFRIKR